MKYFLILCTYFISFNLSAAQQHPEDRLLDAVRSIQSQDLQQAEKKLAKLLTEKPDFKLAQLVYADVLTAKSGIISSIGPGVDDGQPKDLLLTEIKNRFIAANDEMLGQKLPVPLARLDAHYEHAIVVDLSKSRLYVFNTAGEKPELIEDYFVSMGRGGSGKVNEGDLKTPVGVYFVQSHIGAEKLADKYGMGAYPLNYPNAWDRLNGRTGYGIWLHGTRSGTYNRPPLASEGCVVLPNDDLLEVGAYIDLKNTPVLIGETVQWLPEADWFSHQQVISTIHQQWEQDWESLDVESYLSHYSQRFTSGKKTFDHWARHKRRIAKHKTYVDVDLENVSLLLHPDEDVMVATFQQSYNSDNYSSQTWKRQYWNKEEDGKWRIVFEDEITPPIKSQLARNILR